MATYEDCRHYVMQSTTAGDKLERCRLGANLDLPFSCPEGCVFHEPRKVSGAGWVVGDQDRRRPS